MLVITQRNGLGSWLDGRWCFHCPTPAELHPWLREVGLQEVRLVELGGAPWCRRMSLAAVAWKGKPRV